MPEPKSYLSTVKAEIDSAFAGVYDVLLPISSNDDELAEALITLKKSIWTIVEKRLKESFQNGRKAANGAEKAPKDRKPNPFRRE